MRRPLVHRFFVRISVLWATVLMLNAGLVFWLLVSSSLRSFLVERSLVTYGLTAIAIFFSITGFMAMMRRDGITVQWASTGRLGSTRNPSAPSGRTGTLPACTSGLDKRKWLVIVRRIAKTGLSLAVLLLWATVGGGVEAAASSGQESFLAGRELPPYLQATLHARQVTQSAGSSVITDPQPVGALVPNSDVVVTAADNHQLRFGLATYSSAGDATYPAISTDAGSTWKIEGPCSTSTLYRVRV